MLNLTLKREKIKIKNLVYKMINLIEDTLKKILDLKNVSSRDIDSYIKLLEGVGCKWRDLGDLEANYARVHITSSSSQTIVERITNAIDATLEQHANKNPEILNVNTPREAVSKIFKIKEGYLVNTPQQTIQKIASEEGIDISIKPLQSNYANLFFRDRGIGLTREEMPGTILSLNESNKLRKKYLMGQYGQGGSTTCAFNDFTIIVSKSNSTPNNKTSYTIIRYNDLVDDLNAKSGKYEYLVSPDNLPPCIDSKEIEFLPGTFVIHLNYHTAVTPGYINYYSLFDQILFDPPIPYNLYYEGEGRRTMAGARRRLEEGEGTQKHDEYAYKFPNNPEYGELVIRWFLLKGNKKTSDYLYEDNFPILITYNGQVQGKIRKSIIKEDCKLGYLSNALVVQAECDKVTPQGRKFLFTTTRDKITESGEKLIQEAIITILSEEDDLIEENERRESMMISKRLDKSTNEMRKKLAEMLKRLDPGKFGMMIIGTKSGIGKRESRPRRTKQELKPLPTKLEPSFLKIVNKQDPIKMFAGGTTRLNLESDAPDGLIGQSWIIELNSSLSEKVKTHSIRNFYGGRSKYLIKLDEKAKIGNTFEINLDLKHVSGKNIKSNIRRVIVIEKPSKHGGKEELINAPNIQPVYEGDEFYKENSWNEDNISEVVRGAEITVYVNMANKWLKSTLSSTNYTEPKKESLKNQYLLHVAFHAFLQDENFKDSTLGDEEKDKIKASEMDRVARTLIVAMTSAASFNE